MWRKNKDKVNKEMKDFLGRLFTINERNELKRTS